MVLVVQVRSSVKCTPRNVVLLTPSTVELSMVSGGWSTEFLLKSITTSFFFSTLRDRLLAPYHVVVCTTPLQSPLQSHVKSGQWMSETSWAG